MSVFLFARSLMEGRGLGRTVLLLGCNFEVGEARRAFAVGRGAVSLSIGQSDALALGDKMEIMIANINAIDYNTVTMLPGMSDLVVAEPGLAVLRALLFDFVKCIDILPALIVACLCLDAFV